MRPLVDAVFWQDLGIDSPEKERYVDWILDRIVKPEFDRHTPALWSVWRQDDNGNRFLVESGLSRDTARRTASEFERRGHKQTYWIEPSRTDD